MHIKSGRQKKITKINQVMNKIITYFGDIFFINQQSSTTKF